MRLLFGVMGVLASSMAFAGVTILVPASGSLPTYFSGTNCRIHTSAQVTGTTLAITKWEVWIGGEKTDSETIPLPNRPPYVAAVTPKVMFDSTHFNDGSSVTVELKVWTNDGGPYSYSSSATAYNKAAIFGRGDMESDPDSAGATETNYQIGLLGSKFTKWLKDDASWDQTHVATRLDDATVWYLNTHGTSSTIFASNGDLDLRHAEPPGNPSVKGRRENAVGTGNPPFNSGTPPVTVAFAYVCYLGMSDTMGNAFLWPKVNHYTGSL